MPSIEGYTVPSQAEARQFAEQCATRIAAGGAGGSAELLQNYDGLYYLHHASGTYKGTPFAQASESLYEDFNSFQKEVIERNIGGAFQAGGSCCVKKVEKGKHGQIATLEISGQLAGRDTTVLVDLSLVKDADGKIVIYRVGQSLGDR
jgi:hypothetical protein